MSNARIRKYNFGSSMIISLIRDKIIVGVPLKDGSYLVARYGVNKSTLLKESKKYRDD